MNDQQKSRYNKIVSIYNVSICAYMMKAKEDNLIKQLKIQIK